jgi:tetratricopeptide (TPR) repeat protein
MDARKEKTFVRVDVAHADDATAVHEELLDAGAMGSGELMQARRMQGTRKRLDSKVHQQRMRLDIGRGPEHGAEPARIAQAKNPVTQLKVEVIVLLRGRADWQHAQASRHPKMQDQIAVAAIDQEIFAAPLDRAHRAAGEPVHILRHRPAQPRLAHRDARDHAARELRLEAAARHFDLGKLRHREGGLCGAPNIPKMGRIQMPRTFRLIIAAAGLSLAGCVALAQTKDIPSSDLNEPMLYEFLLGEIALQRGDNGLAAQTFLDLAKRTRDPRVARRAVEIANQSRMPELALEAAKTWHELDTGSSQALQVVAALLVANKRVDDALPYLEKLLATDGVNLENGFMQLNRLLAANPDKAANLRVVRQLVSKHPQLPQAHFALAQASVSAGDEDAAIAAIRRASALRPDWELAALLEAQIAQRRSPAAAAKVLGDFVAKNPNSREARLNYARVLVMDKRLPEARKQFEAVLAANPGNTEVIYAVGLLAFQLKDFPVAEENMKRLLSLGYRDANGVRYLLGQIAEEQKQWPQAMQWYERITEGEQLIPARMRSANVLARQGKLDEARSFLKRAAAENPDEEAQLIVAEAQLLREANRNQDAFTLLREALQKEPDQPELLYDYALTAEKLERFDVLESNLRKLIEVRPDHAHAYNALGYSFAERNQRLPEARKLIERALELAPDDYFILDSLGWVLYREGDLKGAAEQLRRAYSGRPDAEIGAHLGEVLWVMGERDEANRVWQESLKSGPENETLQKTIQRFKR